MLKESQHHLWWDKILNKRLVEQMEDSGVACHSTVCLIQRKLDELEGETEALSLAVEQSLLQGSVGDKKWRSRVGKKLKFSFSSPPPEEDLNDLRKLNEDFCRLADQSSKLQVTQSRSRLGTQGPANDQKVAECRIVRKTSTKLFGALGRACQLHEEHSAHFRVESQHITFQDDGSLLVRFNMGFLHRLNATSLNLEPAWISVDSILSEANLSATDWMSMPGGTSPFFNMLYESLRLEISIPVQQTETQGISAASGSSRGGDILATTSAPTQPLGDENPTSDRGLPDFCVQHDFCNHLRGKSTAKRYLGYLEKSAPCKHLVYLTAPNTDRLSQEPLSLSAIISAVSQQEHQGKLLQYERLRLARQLSSAVLQYHSIPLLKPSWQSDDIVFFDTSINSPHLNVQVCKKSNPTLELPTQGPDCMSNQHEAFIRNPYLFNLGITLIELARQTPLRDLREEYDYVDGQGSRYTDFLTSNRIAKSLGSSLGVSYGKIVRKCLSCDFKEGTTSLADVSLQAVFYRDVVCELERLENAFAKFQLGSDI